MGSDNTLPAPLQLNEIRTDVELLKRDMMSVQAFIGKMDLAIDKIATASNDISRMLAVHDQSIDVLKGVVEERSKITARDVDSIANRLNAMSEENHSERSRLHQEMLARIEALDDRFDAIEKWKWWGMGAIAVFMFLGPKVQFLQQFFGAG